MKPTISHFDIEPGKTMTWVTDVPYCMKITTRAGAIIEFDVSPHQDVKITAPVGESDINVEVTIPETGPRGPRLVKN